MLSFDELQKKYGNKPKQTVAGPSASDPLYLFGQKDSSLTTPQKIKKYEYIADTEFEDKERQERLIREGQRTLGRIRDREIFQDIFGEPETNYRPQIADLSARLSARTKRGAFGSGFGRAAGLDTYHAAVERLSDATGNTGIADNIRQVRAFADETEAMNPRYAGAGRFAGEAAQALAMYGTLGAAAEGGLAKLGTRLPGVSAFANKNALTRLGTGILAQQAVDTAVMQPAVILQGMAEGKTRAEILEEMKQQAFTDLLFNAGMGVVGAGAKAIGKGVQARKAAKELAAQQAEETVKNVRPFQAGDMPLSDVDIQTDPIYRMLSEEQPKSMNEAFTGKRQTGNTVLHEKMNAPGAAGTSKNISSMNLSSDMKNGLYGRTAGKNENPLLMPEARARLEQELRDLQDVDSLDQKYNEIFLREGEEAAEAFLKKNEQRKEEIMDMLYMPLKKEELQKQRINNALQKEVSSLLSYSGKENKKAAQEAIARAMMEVRRNGSVSEETRKKLFETLFDMGKATNRQNINQEVKDALKKSKFSISSQDAANIADFDTFRKNLMGKVGSVTKDGKNTRVDVAYQELSERFPEFFPDSIMHPAEQLRQIAKVAEDMKIQEFPLKDVTSAEEKELMMQEFLDKFSSAEKQYQNLVRFEAERKARQRQRILESGEDIDVSQLSTKDIVEMYKRKERLQKNADKVKANKILTEGDQAILQKFLHGEISEETIRNTPGVNADAVLEIAEAVKPYNKVSDLIDKYTKSRSAERHQMAEDTIGEIHFGKDGWKDSSTPGYLMRRSPERATEKVAPKETAKAINEKYFLPVHEAEADRQLWLREKKEMANGFGLKKQKKFTIYDPIGKQNQKVDESGMVQFLGERRADLADLAKKTDAASIRKKEALLAEIQSAEAQLTVEERQRIEAVIPILQKEYNDMLMQTNEVLIRNGYPPIPKRRNYWPHMFSDEAEDPLQAAFQKLGFSQGINELPTDIAGKTDSFRPGKSFSSHMLSRTGNKTDFDALRGYDDYIESTSNVIFHTDNIRNLRALEDAIRYRTAPDSIQKEISKIQKNKNLTLDEKRVQLDAKYAELDEIGKQKNGHTLQNYAMYLNEYTNLLAGKQSIKDRVFEKSEMGRSALMFMEKLNRHVAGNMIAGNVRSAITNSIPFTQGMPLISMTSRKRGLQEGFAAAFSRKMDPLTKKSAFLTTRWPEMHINKTALDKYSDFIGGFSNWVDKMTTQSIWRGRYYDNIKKGMAEKEAIREADDFARRLFAGRSKGAVPPMFQAKNPVTRTLTMFQLEPANQIDWYTKDLPKELKEKGILKGSAALAEMIGATYVFNDVFEKWTGARPGLDPLGIAVNFYEDWTGEDVKNIIDAFSDMKDGEGFDIMEETEEPEPEKQKAVLNLGANIGGYVPYVGGIVFDGGRIPQTSALPDPKEIVRAAWPTDDEPTDGKYLKETVGDELSKLLNLGPVVGLNQIRKTMDGLKTMQEGGSYKQSSDGEKLQFAVDTKDPASWVQAALFGKWATPGGQKYVEDGFKPLSAKRTEAQREMQQKFGTTPKDFVDTFQGINKAETREGKVSALKNSGLTDAEKEYIYKREIFTGKTQIEDFDKMRSFGLSFDQAAGAQTALEGIQKKYDEMLNDGLKDKNTLAANEKYNYISGMSIPSGQKQKMLENFAVATRWIPQEATPTLMSEKYQAVSGFMSVDDFEVVRGAVSDVISKEEWTKGLKNDRSRYIKAAIDQYTQGMPYAQKRELYKTFGVAKSLW